MENAIKSIVIDTTASELAEICGKEEQTKFTAMAKQVVASMEKFTNCIPWCMKLFSRRADLSLQMSEVSLKALDDFCGKLPKECKFEEVRERVKAKFEQEVRNSLVTGLTSIEPFLRSLSSAEKFTEEQAEASFKLAAKSAADLTSAQAKTLRSSVLDFEIVCFPIERHADQKILRFCLCVRLRLL